MQNKNVDPLKPHKFKMGSPFCTLT